MKSKHIATLILLAAFAMLGIGCASTVVKNNAGTTLFRTQADVAHLDLHTANGDSLVMDSAIHSVPTLAGGNAAATIVDSAGRGIVGGILAYTAPDALTKIIAGATGSIPTKQATQPQPLTPLGARK